MNRLGIAALIVGTTLAIIVGVWISPLGPTCCDLCP